MLTPEEQDRVTEALLGGDQDPEPYIYDPFYTQLLNSNATVRKRLKKGEHILVQEPDSNYVLRYRPWRERVADYIAQNPIKLIVGGIIGGLAVGAAIFFLAPVIVPTVASIATIIGIVTFGGVVAGAFSSFLHLCFDKVARGIFLDDRKRIPAPLLGVTQATVNSKAKTKASKEEHNEAQSQGGTHHKPPVYEMTADRRQLLNFMKLIEPAMAGHRLSNEEIVGHIKFYFETVGRVVNENMVTEFVKTETFDGSLDLDSVLNSCEHLGNFFPSVKAKIQAQINFIKEMLPVARRSRLSELLRAVSGLTEVSIDNIALCYFQSLKDESKVPQANLILRLARVVLKPEELPDLDKKLIQIRSSYKLLIAKSSGKDVTTLENMPDDELVAVFMTGVLAKKTGTYLANECHIFAASVSESFFNFEFVSNFLPKNKLDGHIFDPVKFHEKSRAIAAAEQARIIHVNKPHNENLQQAMRSFLKLCKVPNVILDQSGHQLKNSFFAQVEKLPIATVCQQFAKLSFCNFWRLDTIGLRQMLALHYQLGGNHQFEQFKSALEQATTENINAHELLRELKNLVINIGEYNEKDLSNCTLEKVFDLFYQNLATLEIVRIRDIYCDLTALNQGGKKYSQQIADFMLLYLEAKQPKYFQALKAPLLGPGGPLNTGTGVAPAVAAPAPLTQLPVTLDI